MGVEVDLLALTRAGAHQRHARVAEPEAPKLGRDGAHDVLYAIIQDPQRGDRSLAEMLLARREVSDVISVAEIHRLTDPENYLGLSAAMADRVLKAG